MHCEFSESLIILVHIETVISRQWFMSTDLCCHVLAEPYFWQLWHFQPTITIFAAPIYMCDSAVYAIALCLSVCPSVTSQCSTIVVKHDIIQITSHKSRRILFSGAKDLGEIPMRSPNWAPNTREVPVGKMWDFWQIASYISKVVQHRPIDSMKGEHEIACAALCRIAIPLMTMTDLTVTLATWISSNVQILQEMLHVLSTICLHMNQKAHAACNFKFHIKRRTSYGRKSQAFTYTL